MKLYVDHRNRNTQWGRLWNRLSFWEKCCYALDAFWLEITEWYYSMKTDAR